MKTVVKLGILAGAGAAGYAGLRRLTAPVPLPGPSGALATVNGEQIHLIDRGAGPAVVLLHGFGGNTFSWRFVIDELARDHRVVAFDFPGFGFSDRTPGLDYGHVAQAGRVIAVMDHLGIDRATIVGHSMGGGIAQRVAVDYPERVTGVVLVGSVNAAEPLPDRSDGGRVAINAIKLAQRAPLLCLAAGRFGLKRTVADPHLVDRAMVEGYMAPLLLPGTVEAIFAMASRVRAETPVDLGRITAPTLVLHGALDRVVPPATAGAIHAGIANSTLVLLPAAAHMVAEEDPAAFLANLADFLVATESH